MVWLLFFGCSLGEVVIIGNASNDGELRLGWDDKAELMRSGQVEILDEDGVSYASAPINDRGGFRVRAPAGQTIYALVSGDDVITAAFRGVSGVESPMYIRPVSAPIRQPDGSLVEKEWRALYGVIEPDVVQFTAPFAGCVGLDAPGGAVLGSVRYALFDFETGNEPPAVQGAELALLDAEGTQRAPCYLDDTGSALDPEATEAGASGKFAFFGVPEGVHTLQVRSAVGPTAYKLEYLTVYVHADGLTPLFPLWVDFPAF